MTFEPKPVVLQKAPEGAEPPINPQPLVFYGDLGVGGGTAELDEELVADLAGTTAATLNIKTHFGAAGDGVTDDTDAVRDAIIYSLTRLPSTRDRNPRVLIPAGVYNVNPNVFSDYDFPAIGTTGANAGSTRDGALFIGEGRRASILRLVTGGEDAWFYDNGSISTQKFERLFFAHIGFRTDDVEHGHGFRQWSQGGEKQFKFFDCDFNLGTIFRAEGTGNADLNRWISCYITAYHNVFDFNNNQSVANELHGCDVTVYRDFVTIRAGGGGATKIIGGNIEMYPHSTDTSTDHFLVNSPVTPSTGQGNADTTFLGTRFEIHGANKKLVKTVGVTGQLNVNFAYCQFGTVSGGSRQAVSVTASRRVLFDQCILHGDFTYHADAGFVASSGNPSGAAIVFRGCDVGLTTPLHSRCTINGDTARITAEGCFRQNSSTSIYPKIAEDFDFGWRGQAPRKSAATVKVAILKPSTEAFPLTDAADTALPRVTLPPGAWVKRIVVKKPTHSGSGTSEVYRLHVGTPDRVTTYGSSTEGTWGGAHSIDISDLGVLSDDTIALWSTGGTISAYSGGAGAIAYIEYI